jgi:hypothetical protein
MNFQRNRVQNGATLDRYHKDRLVTVCSACLKASCWNYEFVCEEYRTAGTVEKTVGELTALGLEHPDHWKPKGE